MKRTFLPLVAVLGACEEVSERDGERGVGDGVPCLEDEGDEGGVGDGGVGAVSCSGEWLETRFRVLPMSVQ